MTLVQKATIGIVLVVGLALFATFVWPTAYRPIAILPQPSQDEGVAVVAARENRFTGQIELLIYSPHQAVWAWTTARQ